MKIDAARFATQIATGLANPLDFESHGVEAVRAAKLSDGIGCLRTVSRAPESIDEGSRTIRYVWSDETVDRYGDIIRASGWDTKDFDGNPIALYMHDMERPIGRGVEYGVSGTELVGGIKFADPGTSAFHDATWKLAAQGILQATSVGFDPLERVWYDDEAERAALGLGQYGVEYLRQRLLEISLVSIPANPSALQLALRPMIDSGDLDEREADAIRAAQITERDWEKRARAIRRRSVTVDADPLAARVAALEHDVRALSVIVTGQRAIDGARKRADADEADARAATEALLRVCDERAATEALDRLISANGGAKQ